MFQRSMRPDATLSFLSILAAVFVSGAACNDADGDDDMTEAVSVTSAALEAEADGMTLGSLAYPEGVLVGQLGATGQERLDALKAWIDARLSCGQVSLSSDGISIVFEQECTWLGTKWSGTVAIAYSADGSSASLTMQGLKVNGATMNGTMEVVKLGESHVSVAAEWTRVRPDGRVIAGAWDAEYSWDDASFTIVSAVHELDIERGTSNLTKSGVRWLRGDYAPEAGTVTFTGFRGRTWTMTFGRDEEGLITVTITNGRGGSRSYAIDGSGAVRLA